MRLRDRLIALLVASHEELGHCRHGADLAKQLIAYLQNIPLTYGIIFKVIVKEHGDHRRVFIWDGEEPNPHLGHLAWVDAFVIIADSISMLSEACSIGYVPRFLLNTALSTSLSMLFGLSVALEVP